MGAILGKSDFAKKCNRMDVTPNRSQHQIKNGDILLTYIGMLCMGKLSFDSVHEFDDDPEFYQYALGITRKIPSEETLRQRMDDIGFSLRGQILAANAEMLQSNGIVPSTLPSGFVPLDIDVTPFDNSKTKKEGVSRTYKESASGELGGEDWLTMAKENARNVSTPREGKTVYIGSDWKNVSLNSEEGKVQNTTIRTGYEILERTIDKHGQFLLPASLEVNT